MRVRRTDLKGTPEGDAHAWAVMLFIAFLIFVSTVFVLSNPKIEGHLFPVMADDFKVVSMKEVDNGTMLAAQATKIRNCIWEETRVYRGVRGERSGSLITRSPHLDAPIVRESGLQEWALIYLPGIKPHEFKDTYADSIHICGGRKVRSALWG